MILQLSGVIIGIAGWILNSYILFVIGGLLCLLMIVVGIFTGSLTPAGMIAVFIISIIAMSLISPWYNGLLSVAILTDAVEVVFSVFLLKLSQRIQNR